MLVGRSLRPLQAHQSCLAIQCGHPEPNVLEGSRGQFFAGLEVPPSASKLRTTSPSSSGRSSATWIIAFFGTGLVLLVRIVRASVTSIALTASVAGPFTAYVVQGMVSIDMLPLLATGWLMAGLALASAREPLPTVQAEKTPAPKTRKAKAASVSRSPQKFDGPSTPAWVPITGGVLALAVAILVGTQIAHVNQIQSLSSQQQALTFIANAMTPCVLRVQVMQQLPPEVGVPVTLQATDLDRRCSPMINFAYDSLVQAGDLRAVTPTA